MRTRRWRLGIAAAIAVLVLAMVVASWMGLWDTDSANNMHVASAPVQVSAQRGDMVPANPAGTAEYPVGAAKRDEPAKTQRRAKDMLLSNDIGQIDYASMTLSLNCLSLRTTEDAWLQQAEARTAQYKAAGDPLVGTAPLAARVAAYRRSRDLCNVFYPDGQPDDEFYRKVRDTPGFQRYRAIHTGLLEADFGAREGAALFKEAWDARMYSAVKRTLFERLELKRFEGQFPEQAAFGILWYATDLLTCRMGDDCGADSIKARQLCWDSGICGGDVESAYKTHLRAAGVDADLFSRLVSELHDRLSRGDTSWLRSQPQKPKS